MLNIAKLIVNMIPAAHKVKNMRGRVVRAVSGHNTVIDPDVVIDEPGLVTIGSHTVIRKGVVLRPEGGAIIIGDNCVINHYCVFHGKGGIYIGDWTIISPHCGFYAQNHRYDRFDIPITQQGNTGEGIYLMGDNWIGSHTVVCDDVTIGKGAVIGAHSTVTSSVPMASVAFGSPARMRKKRYEGAWDFSKVERASSAKDMPHSIRDHANKRAQVIASLVDREDIVLDVGCGEGMGTGSIARECASVTGCDYSHDALTIAKALYPGISFIYSNSTCLRFKDNSFSKVILSDVAEHMLVPQFKKTILEAARVLAGGCALIVATPLTAKGVHGSTYAHIYEYSSREMERLLGSVFQSVKYVNSEFGIFVAMKKVKA